MSSANAILRYAKGSVALGGTFGQALANPAFKRFRQAQDNLKATFRSVESAELLDSYRVKQIRRVGVEASGSSQAELVYGNADDFLEALFFSRWQRTPQRFNDALDDQISGLVAATGIVTIDAAVADDETRWGTPAVGHLVRQSGFTAAGNNGLFLISAATGTSYTIPTAGLVDEPSVPVGARAKVVGLEAAANGDITVSVSGLGSGEVAIINTAALDFVALGIVAGMWIRLSGLVGGEAVSNGLYRVLNVTATRLGCDRAPSTVAAATAAGVKARIWLPDYLRDGTLALVWFDLERYLQSLATPEYHYFLSMVPSVFALDLSPKGIQQARLDFLGASRTTGTTRVAGATDVTADALGALPRDGDMFDTANNVGTIRIGGTPLDGVVTQLGFNIANGVQGLDVIGSLGFGRVSRRRFRPTVTLRSYYDARDQLAQLEADTEVSVDSFLTDPLGTRGLVIDYPAAKLQTGDVEGIQVDSELAQPLTLAAIEHVGFNCACQLARFEEFA